MTDFLKLLKRFALPYKLNIFLSLFFNLLTAMLTIFRNGIGQSSGPQVVKLRSCSSKVAV